VLEDLMKDMDDFEFEKKVKPKILTITIDTSGGEMSMDDGEGMGEEPDFMSMLDGEEYDEEEGDDDLDPRLKKKLGG
jgi:hypothetical protein